MKKETLVSIALAAAMALASGSALAGDAGKGEKVFKKCKACHDTRPGVNKVGPSLAGVFGRKAGTEPKFKRYKGLKDADWTWDEKLLDEYLADPTKFTKAKTGQRSAMTFKLTKADERDDVIAYLKTLK